MTTSGFLCLALLGLGGQENQRPVTHDLALVDVDVFDSATGAVLEGRTLLIDGDTITALVGENEAFSARRAIAGEGRLATPGFVDTHAHLLLLFGNGGFGLGTLIETDRELLGRTYLTHGVTTIADMGQPEGWLTTMLAWQRLPVPDAPNLFVVGGSLISDLSWDTHPPSHHTKLATPEIARAKVDEYAALGIERLKLYWKLEPREMAAIIDQGRTHDMAFFAHVDNGIVSIQQAMDLGVRHFEHFFTLASSILNDDDRRIISATYGLGPLRNLDEYAAVFSIDFDYLVRTPEPRERLDALLDRMAAEHVSLSTTLNILAAAAGRSATFSGFDPLPIRSEADTTYDVEQRQAVSAAFDAVLDTLRSAHARGLTLRIGTDARNGGEALLAELVLLGEAGFPPADILQIATRNGAHALGIDSRHGAIAPGRAADLILFDASPLADIRNVQGGKTVIKGGVPYTAKPSLASALREHLETAGIEHAPEWLTETRAGGRLGPPQPSEFAETITQLVESGHVAEARTMRALLPRLQETSAGFQLFDEEHLTRIGSAALEKQRVDDAIATFTFVTELFPDSWNAHDSLGEAYLANEDLDNAVTSYRRSVELNPGNAHGLEVLRDLAGAGDQR